MKRWSLVGMPIVLLVVLLGIAMVRDLNNKNFFGKAT